MMSTVSPKVVDERIPREQRHGEIKFKQIKLTDKRSKNEIYLLVRKSGPK